MKRTIAPMLPRAIVACATLALAACLPNTSKIRVDPAVTAILDSQPKDYDGLARWVTQFMRTDVAAQHLKDAGFTCTEYVDEAATAQSVQPYAGFLRKSYVCRENALIMHTVITLQTSPYGFVAQASGERRYAFLDKPADKMSAPGITFANAQALADFAADVLHPSRLSTYCVSPDKSAQQCADWAGARARGWPKRGTQAVAAGTAQQVVEHLEQAGFICPPWNRQNMRSDVNTSPDANPDSTSAGNAAGDVLWMTCRAQALQGGQMQVLRVGVSMEDGTTRTVRAQLGSEVAEIALAPKPEDEDPSVRRVMLRDTTGKIQQIELRTSVQGQMQPFDTLVKTADPASRTRLLRVMLDMTEDNLKRFPAQSAVPVLQQIDSGAALFGLENDTLAAELPTWSLTPLGKTVGIKTRAALAMARCLHGDAPTATACYATVRMSDPQVHTLLLAALAEVKPDTDLLPPDHAVAQRLKYLRAVLGVQIDG